MTLSADDELAKVVREVRLQIKIELRQEQANESALTSRLQLSTKRIQTLIRQLQLLEMVSYSEKAPQ